MKINWKSRIKSKKFWVSLVALLLVLANQLAEIFGISIVIHSENITEVTETVLMILALIGIISESNEKDGEL